MEEKEKKLPKLKPTHSIFIDHYFSQDVNFNGTEAYHRTYPKATRETCRRNASDLLTKADVQAHIQARFAELEMSRGEAAAILTRHARGNIGFFFKLSEEWLADPLPTYEVLREKKEVDLTDPENPKERILYFCRHVVIDVDKVLDPKYSHLIKEFGDSPKNGLTLKLHDPQSAISQMLRIMGAFKDNSDILSTVDLSKLSMSQLEKLRKGVNVIEVLTNPD